MPAEIAEISDSEEVPAPAEFPPDAHEPSLVPEADSQRDEPAVGIEASGLNHNILHLPIWANCSICQEAKQDALPARVLRAQELWLTESQVQVLRIGFIQNLSL